jgi:hypothetical protein
LDLFHKNNSFGQLYKTCDKTRNMIADLNYTYSSRQNLQGKIKYCRQNNSILLKNYRGCVADLGNALDKSTNLILAKIK